MPKLINNTTKTKLALHDFFIVPTSHTGGCLYDRR
jgi:hypothetical protein